MKKFILILTVIISLLGFFGCGGGSGGVGGGGDTYWVRGFLISISDGDAIAAANGITTTWDSTLSYSQVLKIYNEAYAKKYGADRAYIQGLTESTIRSRLQNETDLTPSEIDDSVSGLKREGNLILYFWGYSNIPSGYYLVYYFERE